MPGVEGGDSRRQKRQQYRLEHAVMETSLHREQRRRTAVRPDWRRTSVSEVKDQAPALPSEGNVFGWTGNAVVLTELTELILSDA